MAWPRRILLIILAVGIAGYFAANSDMLQKLSIFGAAQTGSGGRVAGAPPPVRVATAQTSDVAVTVRTIGTVLANSIVTVKSQVDGPLLSAGFKEGQMVKKGDLLFRIDPAPFEASLRQAQASVARDQAQLASAQADADRGVMLSDRGIVATQQRDQLVAAAKALAATVASDQAAVDRAKLNLDYTSIYSPINGKTGAYIVYPGNQVHAADAGGLVTITQIQPVKISFNLPQGDLPQLQDRMREGMLIAGVMIRSDVAAAAANLADQTGADKHIPVKVDFVGNIVDDKTGTIELRATFDNPDLRLVPGELVDVIVRLETLNQVTTVPREAVNIGQNGNYVFVIDNAMKAQMRPVTVLYQDQVIAALGGKIQPGERVVTDGQLRLIPGAEVQITEPAATPAAQETRQPTQASSQDTISKSAGAQPANPGSAGGQGHGG